MAYYNGLNESAKFFASLNVGGGSPFTAIDGFSYSGTSEDDITVGSVYAYQNRTYQGYPGQDFVFGHDTLGGGAGNDGVDGYDGNDSVSGGDGTDSLSGSGGNDYVHGNMGNDQISGGDGNDTVVGGQGSDGILGDAGNDFITGDAGNDVMAGGSGADTFNVALGFGADIVQDFNRSQGDSVKVSSGSYSVAQVGADSVVTMSDGATLTLQNVTYSLLDSGWIHT